MELAPDRLFSLDGKVAVVTGGTGVLGSAMARGLAAAGARVGILGRRENRAQDVCSAIQEAGGEAMPLAADVLALDQLRVARDDLLQRWDKIDIVVNVAGGNVAQATVVGDLTFFDLTRQAFEEVVDLNLSGTLLPTQVFGEVLAQNRTGVVINISSMAAQRPLTRVVGYCAAKAAIDNFTRWLSVEMAKKYGPGLRVNAIAPGFFVGDQNRRLLLNEDESLTERGQLIIDHTPMERFGEPEELVGALVWLCSEGARFVTGIVVPVDGGFSAYAGI